MGPTSAIVLYAVLWSLTLLTIAPVRIRTQGDLGKIVEGTHAGAPEVHHLKTKLWVATAIATVLWILTAGVILSGAVSVRDIDMFHRMNPPAAQQG